MLGEFKGAWCLQEPSQGCSGEAQWCVGASGARPGRRRSVYVSLWCCLGFLHPKPQFPKEGGGWVESRAPPSSGITVRGAGRGAACKPGHQGLSGDLSRAPRDRAGGAGRAAAAGRGPGLQRGSARPPAPAAGSGGAVARSLCERQGR